MKYFRLTCSGESILYAPFPLHPEYLKSSYFSNLERKEETNIQHTLCLGTRLSTNRNKIRPNNIHLWHTDFERLSWAPNGKKIIINLDTIYILNKFKITEFNQYNICLKYLNKNILYKAFFPLLRPRVTHKYNLTKSIFLTRKGAIHKKIQEENITFNDYNQLHEFIKKNIFTSNELYPSNLILNVLEDFLYEPFFGFIISERLLDELILNNIQVPVKLIHDCEIGFDFDFEYHSKVDKKYNDDYSLIYEKDDSLNPEFNRPVFPVN